MSRMKEMPSTGAFLRSSVAFRADVDFVRIFTGKQKRLGDHALEYPAVIDHEKPGHRFVVLELLPQPGRRRLLRGNGGGKDERHHDRQYQSNSGKYISQRISHDGHLINSANEWPQTKAISRTVPVSVRTIGPRRTRRGHILVGIS